MARSLGHDGNNHPARTFFAHSANAAGQRQLLITHLQEVARLAQEFAGKIGASELGWLAGMWHDSGKAHAGFQRYLLDAEAGKAARTGPDHKGAGAVLASRHCQLLAYAIAGHHGGLPNDGDLRGWLKERSADTAVADALRVARSLGIGPPDCNPGLPEHVQDPLQAEMFIRMLFSALVDADFLDTEAHMQPDRSTLRGDYLSLKDLWLRLEDYHTSHLTRRDDEVTRVREEVYRACLNAAGLPAGFFRLTVPTGGGKTLSGLAFALRHAIEHGMDRVIVAVPYTTITEQTAAVYRTAFDDDRAVLEHHSAAQLLHESPEYDADPRAIWARLASESWDAPVIVTTTVQLFESLLACKPSRCRKLHNVARSVIPNFCAKFGGYQIPRRTLTIEVERCGFPMRYG